MKNIDKSSEELVLNAMLDWEDNFNTMVTVHDKDFNIIRANKSAEKILGMSLSEIKKRKCFMNYHGKDRPPEGCPSCKCLITEEPTSFDIFEPHLNMFLEIRVLPRFDSNDNLAGLIHIVRDITDRKMMGERIKASLKEKDLLLKEIHHRVGNNLQVIYSLLHMQSAHIKDKHSLDIFKGCQNRIMSMSLIHKTLYKSKDLTHIDVHDYIIRLSNRLFQSYGVSTDRVVLKINVTDVSLGLDAAIPCGLIISELVSNSLKHAFPEEREGEIKIALLSSDKKEYELIVSDNGIGLPENLDFRNTETLGFKIVLMFGEENLKGKIDLNSDEGTQFLIRFKA